LDFVFELKFIGTHNKAYVDPKISIKQI